MFLPAFQTCVTMMTHIYRVHMLPFDTPLFVKSLLRSVSLDYRQEGAPKFRSQPRGFAKEIS